MTGVQTCALPISILPFLEKQKEHGQNLINFGQTKYHGVEFVKTNILRPSLPKMEFPSSSYEFCKFPFLIAFAVFEF